MKPDELILTDTKRSKTFDLERPERIVHQQRNVAAPQFGAREIVHEPVRVVGTATQKECLGCRQCGRRRMNEFDAIGWHDTEMVSRQRRKRGLSVGVAERVLAREHEPLAR
jgi:hypothetical protein